MKTKSNEMILTKLQNQEKVYSQLTGLLYLIIAVVGGFSIGFMPSEIVVEGNASATFSNLLENQVLFKWGITGDILVLVLEILLTVMLYQLLKPYSKTGMSVATYSRFAMAIIMGFNLLNYMVPAVIMMQPEYLSTFSQAQLESFTLLFFKIHKYGELSWQIFFSIHLFTLGYVILKSGLISKWIGYFMLLGGIGYAGDSFIQFILSNSQGLSIFFSVLLVCAVISEFWFAFWLIIKGIKK